MFLHPWGRAKISMQQLFISSNEPGDLIKPNEGVVCVLSPRDWQWQVSERLRCERDEEAPRNGLANVTPDKVGWKSSGNK